ncbi:scoloptoxin SSD14 isoform X1 [Drosophila willistoni]|uniref:scoloptoxin SSD14 isoform X1 n=2 Tax=Drosophila willistoni TaxID=7260 RepID=UPI001F07BB4C|nr:scoloptoxin SSD14 isoform X1 [Drosophila willistoni]
MHSTTCGVSASATNLTALQSTGGGASDAHKMVHHNNEDAMNKIPLKSASGLDDEEKNGGELMQDTAAVEEARREQMRANMLAWMKKLTIVLICFIGIALISYVIISLCFSDEQQDAEDSSSSSSSSNNMDNLRMDGTTSASGLLAPNVAASTLPTSAPGLDTSFDARYNANVTFQSKLGVYQNAAVCTDRVECSQIASDILSRNGSAVDAAIAALLCNGLIMPQSMGIGGGNLMNVYKRKNRHAYSIDAREVAPYAAEEDMFSANPNASLYGPLSIAVPGELMGYHEAHKRFGQLPWSELVAPSLKLCETGYQITTHMHDSLKRMYLTIKDKFGFEHYFNKDTGSLHKPGTLIKPLKERCASYQLIADNGPLDFYNGTLASLLLEDLKEMGSLVKAGDLQNYEADVVNSITMDLGENTLYVMPPVSSGSLVAHALSILQGYNFTKADLADDESKARTYHRIAEAMKFAFARRGELGDLRANDVRELISQLNSVEFGAEHRAMINDSSVLDGPQEYGAQFASNDESHGTSHMSIVAPNGDAVSVTSSVNLYFGANLVGPRTGIILNSGMNDFSVESNYFGVPQSQANVIGPYKRAMSSMSPVLLADKEGDIRLVVGSAGGTRIVDAIVLVIARVLWFGEDLKTAIDAPRFHHQLFPDVFEYQPDGFSDAVLQLIAKRGHVLKKSAPVTSVVCAIEKNATGIYANADYRKRGEVAGF